VKESGSELGGDAFCRTTITEGLSGRRLLRIGVASLDHEILDDPVKKRAVVIARLHQPKEIISVERS